MKLLPILKALRFNNRSTSELRAISRADWPRLLDETDREGLTLSLGIRCRGLLPPMIQVRIDHNLDSNAQRHARLLTAYAEIADALQSRNLEFAVLKGLSKARFYAADLRFRPQYDIDLYVPAQSLDDARKAMEKLGYEALPEGPGRISDHLPRMIRKTGWRWRQDYFDPEMPTAVELHFQFWNERDERFGAGDLAPFWTRRVIREVAGLQLPALNETDALSYSALHMMRHFFHGALQWHHVYEMAHFLDTSAANGPFWSEWSETGLKSCRVLEGIAFRLAVEWFHCSLHPAARRTIDELPEPVQRWFQLFASGPSCRNELRNDLLLHLSLVQSSRDRRELILRRLFPVRQGRITLDAHVPQHQMTFVMCLRDFLYKSQFVIKRFVSHARTMASTVWGSLRWTADEKWRTRPRLSSHRKHLSETF